TADESLVVIRFKDPKGIDFSYLISMIQGSFMSRANSIVIPGGKLDLAMQLILTPIIMQLVERRRRLAWGRPSSRAFGWFPGRRLCWAATCLSPSGGVRG